MNNLFAQKLSELLAGLVVTALGIYVLVEAQGFPTLPGNDYGADLFPKIIGLVLTLGGAWVFIKAVHPFLLARLQRPATPLSHTLLFLFRLILPLLLIIAYLLLADTLGAILTLTLLVIILMLCNGVRWPLAIVLAAATSAVIWFAFVYMLKVPLPLGVLLG